MEIEIELIGKSSKWALNQPLIRIGRSAKCDVTLPAKQYPSVGLEHVALEVFESSVRLAGGSGVHGDTYINDHPASEGAVVQTGDIVRLGAAGPELRIRFSEISSRPIVSGYEPTRLIRLGEARPLHEATRVVSIPSMMSESEVRKPSIGAAANKFSLPPAPPPAAPTVDARYSSLASSSASVRSGGVPPVDRSDRGQESRNPMLTQKPVTPGSQSVAGATAGGGDLARIEAKLKFMQYTQLATFAVLVMMFLWSFQLNRQLSQTQDDVRALRVQAQSAVSQFAPELDSKLSNFEKQIDGVDSKLKGTEENMEADMDAKMKQAQNEMFANIDSKMKATEDRMVNRMNTELPNLLDKYINQRLAEFKH